MTAEFDHHCSTIGCPSLGQRSTRGSCLCHRTREQMMADEIDRLRAIVAKPLSTYPEDRATMLALCADIENNWGTDKLETPAVALADLVKAILDDEAPLARTAALQQSKFDVTTTGVLQDDLRELLDILGLVCSAQSASPHEVFQGALSTLRTKIAAPELAIQSIDYWRGCNCDYEHGEGVRKAIEMFREFLVSPTDTIGASR